MRRRDLMTILAGAAAYPLLASAQQKSMPVIGYLSSASRVTYPPAYVAAFGKGLGETGYIEGKTATIEYRWAENHYDRLPELAKELVDRKVDVIAATGGIVSALAA